MVGLGDCSCTPSLEQVIEVFGFLWQVHQEDVTHEETFGYSLGSLAPRVIIVEAEVYLGVLVDELKLA